MYYALLQHLSLNCSLFKHLHYIYQQLLKQLATNVYSEMIYAKHLLFSPMATAKSDSHYFIFSPCTTVEDVGVNEKGMA